jgi:hypothetical protein
MALKLHNQSISATERSKGEALTHALCVFLFEGDMCRRIIQRWLAFPSRPHQSLQCNLGVLLRGVCLSEIRVKIAQRYMQIFDCDELQIMSDTLEDKNHPHIVLIMSKLFDHFSKKTMDAGQREFSLDGFNYNEFMEHTLSRYTLLRRLVESILVEAAQTAQFVWVRECIEMILVELYAEAERDERTRWHIAYTIRDIRASMKLGIAHGDGFAFLPSGPICALTDSQYCVLHRSHGSGTGTDG